MASVEATEIIEDFLLPVPVSSKDTFSDNSFKDHAMFIANAFSLQMLASDATVSIQTVDLETAQVIASDAVSAIGHADTAAVVSDLLGTNFAANRVNVTLNKGDQLLVAQVMGGRLPEGATTLPDGMEIAFKLVTVRTHQEEQLFFNAVRDAINGSKNSGF